LAPGPEGTRVVDLETLGWSLISGSGGTRHTPSSMDGFANELASLRPVVVGEAFAQLSVFAVVVPNERLAPRSRAEWLEMFRTSARPIETVPDELAAFALTGAAEALHAVDSFDLVRERLREWNVEDSDRRWSAFEPEDERIDANRWIHEDPRLASAYLALWASDRTADAPERVLSAAYRHRSTFYQHPDRSELFALAALDIAAHVGKERWPGPQFDLSGFARKQHSSEKQPDHAALYAAFVERPALHSPAALDVWTSARTEFLGRWLVHRPRHESMGSLELNAWRSVPIVVFALALLLTRWPRTSEYRPIDIGSFVLTIAITYFAWFGSTKWWSTPSVIPLAIVPGLALVLGRRRLEPHSWIVPALVGASAIALLIGAALEVLGLATWPLTATSAVPADRSSLAGTAGALVVLAAAEVASKSGRARPVVLHGIAVAACCVAPLVLVHPVASSGLTLALYFGLVGELNGHRRQNASSRATKRGESALTTAL
jgi:hypothetical protein